VTIQALFPDPASPDPLNPIMINDNRVILVPEDPALDYEDYVDINTQLPLVPGLDFGKDLVLLSDGAGEFRYRVYLRYDAQPDLDLSEPIVIREIVGGSYHDRVINPTDLCAITHYPGGRTPNGNGSGLPPFFY